MTLHHVFALIGYLAKDDDWWHIYKDIHNTTRGKTVVYEDWRYGGLGGRGGMLEDRIRVAVDQYTQEQRNAFDQSGTAVDTAATRLGVTLPNNPVAHNAQTATAADHLANPTPTASTADGVPAATSTSSGVTAGGSNTSTIQ